MQNLLVRAQQWARRWTGVSAVIIPLALYGVGICAAQAPDAAKPVPPRPMARDANPDWEVATVKASDPNSTRGQHISMPGRRVVLSDTTVQEFLLLGFGVQQVQLIGLPDWARTVRWTVDGVPDAEGRPSLQQIELLIQKILKERFGLQLHHEQRELPVFALTVARGGPKMTVNTTDPNGWFDQKNGEGNGRHTEVLKNISMADLALILQFHVDRPVVDQTGLKGRYDLKLQWSRDEAPPSDTPDAPPGLFTAIQDQIGLKLDRVRAPADVLVIDKLTKPEAN